MEIAQAAFAVLDVRLDQIARLAGAADALLALGELGGDEFGAVPRTTSLVETRTNSSNSSRSPSRKRASRMRGADGHVGLGLADALVDRARGVADLEPDVPQAIEDRLGDLLAPGGLLVGQHEQQIDVGARRLSPRP